MCMYDTNDTYYIKHNNLLIYLMKFEVIVTSDYHWMIMQNIDKNTIFGETGEEIVK